MTVGRLRTPALLLVEALWSFAAAALAVQFLGQRDGPAPSIITVAIVVGASFVVARVIAAGGDADGDVDPSSGVALSVAAIAAIALVTYAAPAGSLHGLARFFAHPGDVIASNAHVVAGVGAMGALWIRGVRRGSLPGIDADHALASVTAGFVAVTIAAISHPDVQGDVAWGALAFAYAVVALLTLALFNAMPSTPVATLARGWPLAFAALACVALVLTLVAGTLDRSLFGAFAPLAGPGEAAGRALRDYLLAPVFWLFALPFRGLFWLLDAVAPGAHAPPPVPPSRSEREPTPDGGEPLWFRILIASGTAAAAIVVAGVALLLLRQAFRRYLARRASDANEEREDLEPSLRDELGALLGAVGRRFRRRPGDASAVAIRRLYFEMLAAAEDRGLPRAPSQTPSQFAPALDRRFASAVPSQISAAFVESRYAGRAIDDLRVRALREGWRAALAAAR